MEYLPLEFYALKLVRHLDVLTEASDRLVKEIWNGERNEIFADIFKLTIIAGGTPDLKLD
jgi:hypothetical protein